MKKLLAILMALVLSMSLLACGGDKDDAADGTTAAPAAENGGDESEAPEGGDAAGGTIKVAVAAPMTGDNAEYGIGFSNAAKLMAQSWNDNGGVDVGGTKYNVEIVDYDDANDTDEAAVVAAEIVSDSDIYGVIGHFASGVCMVAAPTYNDAQYVNISPSSSHADYSSIGDYIFRNNTVISVETATSADIAITDLGCKNIGVLSIDTEWGQSAGDAMEENVKSLGGTVALRQEVSETAVDFATEIANFRDAGCDCIMIAGMYSTVGPFIVAMQDSGLNLPVVGCSNAYTDQLLEYASQAADIKVYAPVSFFAGNPDEAVQEYVKAYTDAYGSTPSALTTQAYDSVGILLEAIQKAGSLDREAIMKAMYETDYQGMSGHTTFDEIGDAQKEFTKVTIEDGAWVLYEK